MSGWDQEYDLGLVEPRPRSAWRVLARKFAPGLVYAAVIWSALVWMVWL